MTDIAVQTPASVVRADQPGRLEAAQIKFIANTDFVPRSYRGNIPAIMACIQTGRELGLGDLEALRSINVIDGRPSLSAELMVKLVRRYGHSIVGKSGEGVATVTGRRADNGDEMTVEWTLAMATRAGLVTKDNWKKYPEAMLWARAVTQLCRMLFPDCLRGLSYTSDEVEMSEDERIGEAVSTEHAPMPVEAGPDDTAIVILEAEEAENIAAEGEQAELSFEAQAAQAQRARAAKGTK